MHKESLIALSYVGISFCCASEILFYAECLNSCFSASSLEKKWNANHFKWMNVLLFAHLLIHLYNLELKEYQATVKLVQRIQ